MTESTGRIVVDGVPIEARTADSVAVAILRAGEVPGRGGTLCLAGDCGNCVANVDGVAYVRTCQTPARPGLRVVRHPPAAMPPLPTATGAGLTLPPPQRDIAVARAEVDVAIIGAGPAGLAAAAEAQSAGRSSLVLDASAGQEVVAVYPGPTVIARTEAGMLHVRAAEIVVATGAAEIHPVCSGNELAGLLTARAAGILATADVDLGHAVAVGTAP
ncbi:MAG: 2Fe-2S iron-sulfur cluster-binding protein, partial [Candidatus Limnocylindrales bacterium]